MSDRFELEQLILKCWGITDDVKIMAESPDNTEQLKALAVVYDVHFERLWKLFTTMIQERKIQ